ncbi:MAG TPA: hypothetical protein VFA43_00440 [Gemmatimonadaceae bacterium]|nr:hypothetical protein [Gemmatimonadaceae bacterium]
MPLVYIDTSTSSVLAKVLQSDSARFNSFLSVWNAKDCTLALPLPLVGEILQHASSIERDARFDLFEQLVPARTDLPTIGRNILPVRAGDREIARVILASGVPSGARSLTQQDITFLTDVLPKSTDAGWAVTDARAFHSSQYTSAASAVHAYNAAAATARTRPANTPYKRLKFADLPLAPLAASQVAQGLQAIDSLIASPAQLAFQYPFLSEPMRLDRAAYERAIVVGAATDGLERSIARAAGATGSADKRYLDEYFFDLELKQTAEEVACATLGINAVTDVRSAIQSVTLLSCPGRWLKKHAELEWRKATPTPAGSDAFDFEHLLYFPYVDVFFCDKRTKVYADRALALQSCPAALQGKRSPITTSSDINAIEAVIAGL